MGDDRARDAAWTPEIELATAKAAAKEYHDLYEAKCSEARVLLNERDAAIARAKKCEEDWQLDLLKHTTQIRAERDAARAALAAVKP